MLILVLFSILNGRTLASNTHQNIFSYTVKVRNAVEGLDVIFERAEVNVNVMVDSISNSYDASKQQDKAYNIKFIKGINGLVKSVLSNSPGVDGSWFQINADLPFSAEAYNWYEFKENQFVNVKDQFVGTSSMNRKITPEDDPYYFNAVYNRKPTWSDIYTDPDTKNAMVTISAPIDKDGALVGVVGIDISINNIQQIINQMRTILGDCELYLLDKNNKVILTQSDSNSKKENYQFLSLFKYNNEGPIEYKDNLTKKTAVMFTLSNGYKIVISIKDNTLYADTNQMSTINYGLFILLVLSTLIAFANQLKINKLNEELEFFDKNLDTKPTQEEE